MPNNTTKLALEAALKQLLLKKPIDKITISDLTETCGISRMAFYYHFKDIYDLVEWVCIEDGVKALRGKKTYDTWQEGLTQVFEAALENKPFIMNIYRAVSRQHLENYLNRLTYELIANVVEEKCACERESTGESLSEEDKRFIAEFYKYAFVGIMLDWIDRGMKDDYQELVRLIGITLRGNIVNSIRNFEEHKEN